MAVAVQNVHSAKFTYDQRSGSRTAWTRPARWKHFTKHSNHNHGRAIDFAIEGVPNTVVRDICRTFRNAGVGYSPNSTFVHLGVRNIKTYWIDYSRPAEPPRYAPAHR